MPAFQAFLLFFLFVAVSILGPAQAQDPGADDPVQAASDGMPTSVEKKPPPESLASPEEPSLISFPDSMSLYSSDVLTDMPYVYPLLRMRLAPEMKQGVP